MIVSAIALLALATASDALHLANWVRQVVEGRSPYQGSWALDMPEACPQNYSTACGDTKVVNQQCCRTTDQCFSSGLPYCCPSGQDCQTYVLNFPVCADPTATMFSQFNGFFCCRQGFTGVIPNTGWGFCAPANITVPVSLLATMASQFGGAATGSPGSDATGSPGSDATPTGEAGSSGSTSGSGSSSTSSSPGFNLSTPAIVGIAVGAFVIMVVALSIWKCCKKIELNRALSERSHRPGPSVMPAYLPPAPMYAPIPAQAHTQRIYDPVLERRTAVSPFSPLSPSPPPYNAVDAHELAESRERRNELAESRGRGNELTGSSRRGLYDPVEVHGNESSRELVEMG